MIHFTLYSRSYCHLCDEMLQALQSFKNVYAFTVDVVDVDADEALITLYDELVPVLVASKNGAAVREVCHHFFDENKIKTFFVE